MFVHVEAKITIMFGLEFLALWLRMLLSCRPAGKKQSWVIIWEENKAPMHVIYFFYTESWAMI